jgi:hypothetical protein
MHGRTWQLLLLQVTEPATHVGALFCLQVAMLFAGLERHDRHLAVECWQSLQVVHSLLHMVHAAQAARSERAAAHAQQVPCQQHRAGFRKLA